MAGVRSNISYDKEQIDKYIEFCMRSVEVMMRIDFKQETEACLDELTDLILRIFRVHKMD